MAISLELLARVAHEAPYSLQEAPGFVQQIDLIASSGSDFERAYRMFRGLGRIVQEVGAKTTFPAMDELHKEMGKWRRRVNIERRKGSANL